MAIAHPPASAVPAVATASAQPRRRPRHTAKKANRNPARAAIATWQTHEAAVKASCATLEAADPAAAMEGDKSVLAAAWELRRGELDAATLPPAGEAQALLGKASRSGDIDGMERAVAAGADVHARVFSEWTHGVGGNCTAAYIAAKCGNAAGVRLLVGACGGEANGEGTDGWTAIHAAVTPRQKQSTPAAGGVQVLLALGADPTRTNARGTTPAMYLLANGCAYDHEPCMKALAKGGPGGALGADTVNLVSTLTGKTALDWALERNAAECVALLHELGGKRAADL